MKLGDMKIGVRLEQGSVQYWRCNCGGHRGLLGSEGSPGNDGQNADGGRRLRRACGTGAANVLGLRRFEKDMFINVGSKESVEKYYAEWKEEVESVRKRAADIEKVKSLKDAQETASVIKTNLEVYAAGVQKVVEKIKSGEITTTEQANAGVADVKDESHKMEAAARTARARHTRRCMKRKRASTSTRPAPLRSS